MVVSRRWSVAGTEMQRVLGLPGGRSRRGDGGTRSSQGPRFPGAGGANRNRLTSEISRFGVLRQPQPRQGLRVGQFPQVASTMTQPRATRHYLRYLLRR